MLNITETLKYFQKMNVLVIGDVMLDCYLYGSTDRISPEAPVPVISLAQRKYHPGGAANVALNLKSLGAQPHLFSVVGDDSAGEKLRHLLPQHNISTEFLHISKIRQTTSKTRILAQNQQLLRFDEEDTFDLDDTEFKAILSSINNLVESQEIDVIVFQDYNKGVLTLDMIRKIMLIALRHNIPTVVDPKNKNFFAYNRATLFKPNLKEINGNLPFQSKTNLKDLAKAADYLNQKLNNPNTLITLSEKGIYYRNNSKEAILPTNPRKIADVCGAGDSVISVAALGIALNLPLPEIALLANLAGGQVCEKVGVVPVSAKELAKDYQNLYSQQ